MILVKPPERGISWQGRGVFLAGSIEMGAAENWQARVEKLLADTPWTVFNPRRDDWDPTWEQSIHNQHFHGQVSWELDAIEWADQVIMYFDPNTKSPITLLELGLLARGSPSKLIVVCPEGFWRKGNVDIVCERYGVRTAATVLEATQKIA